MAESHVNDCAFCKIAAGNLKSYMIFDGPKACAFLDINPRNPGHTLVVTKKHYENMLDLPESEIGDLFKVVKRVSLALKKGMKADGISIALSNESAAGQVVKHIHVHVIPRFSSEDPISVEGMLPLKNLSKQEMSRVAAKLKSSL